MGLHEGFAGLETPLTPPISMQTMPLTHVVLLCEPHGFIINLFIALHYATLFPLRLNKQSTN